MIPIPGSITQSISFKLKIVAAESAVFLAQLLSAFYGEAFTVDDFLALGEKIFKTEVGFNRRAGISLVEDRLPEFMLKESLPPTDAAFTVDQEEIDKAFAHLREDQEKQ